MFAAFEINQNSSRDIGWKSQKVFYIRQKLKNNFENFFRFKCHLIAGIKTKNSSYCPLLLTFRLFLGFSTAQAPDGEKFCGSTYDVEISSTTGPSNIKGSIQLHLKGSKSDYETSFQGLVCNRYSFLCSIYWPKTVNSSVCCHISFFVM